MSPATTSIPELERGANGCSRPGGCARRSTFIYLCAWHFLELPWQLGDPAGAVVGARAGAPLGGGDEAEDNCCEPFEFNDGSAGTCVPAVLCGIPP